MEVKTFLVAMGLGAAAGTAVGMMMPRNRAMQKMGRQVTCAAEDAVVRAMDTVEKKLH